MPKHILKYIGKFFANFLSNIIVVILVGIFGVSTLIAWATGTLNLFLHTLNTPTPLLATIALALLCCLYTYVKVRQCQNSYKPSNIQEELIEEFGIYWNNKYKPRCLYCKYPLKCASNDFDLSVFFCSNCNRKHALRDPNGNHMTEAKAIEQLKIANKSLEPTGDAGSFS